MLDCIIKGGTVIDGTGQPGVRCDVGIRDGKVAALGKITESARNVIDADGLIVAPGFIDVHTHYDAQIMWDPAATPSSLHGVTTIIGGNCGFTIAPVTEKSFDYVMRMLSRVEGLPVESLETGLDLRWKTFKDWLALLDGNVSINTAFLVGHSTIRRLVMGEQWQDKASPEQIKQMSTIVAESVRGGAFGFSSSWAEAHADHHGDEVPSRYADKAELVALAGTLRPFPGTVLEFIPTITPVFPDKAADVMAEMSAAAQRFLNWNLLQVGPGQDKETNKSRLGASDRAAKQGGEVVALTLPVPQQLRLNLLNPPLSFNHLPTWRETLALPVKERTAAFKDPDTRRRMAEDVAGDVKRIAHSFAEMTVESLASPKLQHLAGRLISDIAKERKCTALEAFLDIAVEDDLQTGFRTPRGSDDAESWKLRAEYWRDPRVIIGGSDAGAHLDVSASFCFATEFIGPIVRDRKLITLEEAIHQMTDRPARRFGLKGRGRIVDGYQADIVIFDAATVNNDKIVIRGDLPAGGSRLYADAIGIKKVLVNGVVIVDDGKLTGATPGTVLRSGRDTVTTGRAAAQAAE